MDEYRRGACEEPREIGGAVCWAAIYSRMTSLSIETYGFQPRWVFLLELCRFSLVDACRFLKGMPVK